MTVLWPAVRDRLVEVIPSLPEFSGVKVYAGPVPTAAAPTAYLCVGWQPSSEDESAGTFSQSEGPDGFSAVEVGAILCELAVSTGSTTMPDVFEMYGAIAAYVQSDQTLGGLLVVASQVGVEAEVVQEQNTSGAVQRLRLSVIYEANAV